MMNDFSKFGFCMIVMLALVLMAVTPNSASSSGMAGSQGGPVTNSLPVS